MGNMLRSPRVTHISWGRMDVDGLGKGKDFKLYPGGGRKWDWTETGTQHQPGIQPADVEELLDRDVEVVVLGIGAYERLGVCPETLKLLSDKGIEGHVLRTEKAVDLYNELQRDRRVGALIHTTC